LERFATALKGELVDQVKPGHDLGYKCVPHRWQDDVAGGP
jgi:hypothetical protein